MIDLAVQIATRAHAGQLRRDGKTPYILHPQHVAALVESWGGTDEQIAAAWLHDVIEDTGWTGDDLLLRGISQDVVTMVHVLTQDDDEPYFSYIDRIVRSESPAILVKFADLISNLSTPLPAEMTGMHRRYAKALAWLGPRVYAATWKP